MKDYHEYAQIGWKKYNASGSLLVTLFATGVIIFFAGIIRWWFWEIRGYSGLATIVVGAGIVFLAMRALRSFFTAFNDLKESQLDLYSEACRSERVVEKQNLFFHAFRSSNEQVDTILVAAARNVSASYQQQVTLLREGMRDQVKGVPDKELWRRHSELMNQLNKEFLLARQEFDRLRLLAEDFGYTVKPTWEHYVGRVSDDPLEVAKEMLAGVNARLENISKS